MATTWLKSHRPYGPLSRYDMAAVQYAAAREARRSWYRNLPDTPAEEAMMERAETAYVAAEAELRAATATRH